MDKQQVQAMAARNRAALARARAEGAETVVLEEFRYSEDEDGNFIGMKPATRRVPVADKVESIRHATDKRDRVRIERASQQHGAAPRPSIGRAPRPATNARRRGSRRGHRASSSSPDDPDPEPEPPPAGGWLTFERFDRLTASLPPHWRCRLHARLPRWLQDHAWDALAAELDERSRR
jgi:hypothetical protein